MTTLAARRPDLEDPAGFVPRAGRHSSATEAFLAAGTSKFVVLPLVEPASAVAWTDHLAEAADVLLPLQTRPAPVERSARGPRLVEGGQPATDVLADVGTW